MINEARAQSPLIPTGSVTWRVFKNPVAAFVGGVAAVLLELAEPRVRTGIWEHSASSEGWRIQREPVPPGQESGAL